VAATGTSGAQQRVAKVHEAVGAAWEAGVQLVAEGTKPHEKVGIGMTAQPDPHDRSRAT
jgi:hypothetical protein